MATIVLGIKGSNLLVDSELSVPYPIIYFQMYWFNSFHSFPQTRSIFLVVFFKLLIIVTVESFFGEKVKQLRVDFS